MTGPAAPTLPIKNRSTVTSGGSGRTPKKGGSASSKNQGAQKPKRWGDITPTPWFDYAPTPWTNTAAAMPPYGVFMGKGGEHKKDVHAHAEAASAWPSTPTPTPKSWGATPTPSSAGSLPQNFGFGGPFPMHGMHLMPPNLAQMQAMAAVGHAAAARAAAAGHVNPASADTSPEERPARKKGAAAAAAAQHDYYAGDSFDSPPWTQSQPNVPIAPGATAVSLSTELPSKGSNMHGTGKCRPCAWFWKPTKCQSGVECNYCHMCPEGELKNRKKLKVAAMRMGALAPAKPGNAGAARTLKLTSLV